MIVRNLRLYSYLNKLSCGALTLQYTNGLKTKWKGRAFLVITQGKHNIKKTLDNLTTENDKTCVPMTPFQEALPAKCRKGRKNYLF